MFDSSDPDCSENEIRKNSERDRRKESRIQKIKKHPELSDFQVIKVF